MSVFRMVLSVRVQLDRAGSADGGRQQGVIRNSRLMSAWRREETPRRPLAPRV